MNYRKSRTYIILYISVLVLSFGAIFAIPIFLKLGNILVERYFFKCQILSKLHVYCPGCGGTRAFSSLIHGKIYESILYNPILIFGIFLYMIVFIDMTRKLISPKFNKWFNYKPALITIVILMLYTLVLRNILAVFFGIDVLGDVSSFWGNL